MHAHQQLPNSLLSLVKCLRKHFPYKQDSWSKRHLGVETQFGPSSVTEAATHAGIVQKRANATHSLSSYHYSCQKNYANLHNIPRDGGFINSLLVFLIYRTLPSVLRWFIVTWHGDTLRRSFSFEVFPAPQLEQVCTCQITKEGVHCSCCYAVRFCQYSEIWALLQTKEIP